MESIKELLNIGLGPSSSHTFAPMKAATIISKKHRDATFIDVYLHGSLALTGKGHLTDAIIEKTLGEIPHKIHFVAKELSGHPNAMRFDIKNKDNDTISYTVYSVGGGKVVFDGEEPTCSTSEVYPHNSLQEVLEYMDENKLTFFDYIKVFEEDIEEYLYRVVDIMFECVESGIGTSGVLPGRLQLKRVAKNLHQQALNTRRISEKERLLVSSYAYGVSEQNASGNTIITAPTCGASGVLPAILYFCYKDLQIEKCDIVKALAVAGIFGNVIKKNATISGAKGGCQAEIGSACAMAAASYGWILELSNELIEYAAEMGLEHNLGLTCDPVGGYVQIPCIERNGFGALRAMDAAMYAKQLGYLRKNKVSFDAVVRVMNETGKDLNSAYKETSLGGLAKEFVLHDED